MGRQTISINALFVGLCALLPVPFLDDLLRRTMMRGAYQSIADGCGVQLQPEQLDTLTKGPSLKMLGCLLGVVWYPIKKLSRKILYFFAIKDALDWTTEAAIRGELVRRALAQGALPDHTDAVRRAMDIAWGAHGGSPITRTVLMSRHDELDWQASEGAAVPVVRVLARRGAGALVIARFEEELQRQLSEGAESPS